MYKRGYNWVFIFIARHKAVKPSNRKQNASKQCFFHFIVHFLFLCFSQHKKERLPKHFMLPKVNLVKLKKLE